MLDRFEEVGDRGIGGVSIDLGPIRIGGGDPEVIGDEREEREERAIAPGTALYALCSGACSGLSRGARRKAAAARLSGR